MRVSTIVTRLAQTCTANESALEIAMRMRHAHVGSLVVIESREGEEVPVGIVTDRDLVSMVMARKLDPSVTTAGEIMSHGICVVGESDEISVALEAMRRSGIRRLPVVTESGALAGIVALDDIAEYLASMLGDMAQIGKSQQAQEERFRA